MITIGKLEFIPFQGHSDLSSETVSSLLASGTLDSQNIGIAEIDPDLSDTDAFCEQYDIDLNIVANCVVLKAQRAKRSWFAACVVPANTRIDVNGLARKTLDARRASFASQEEAVSNTKMEYGAITPIGLPSDWPILIDSALISLDQVILGSGLRKSKLLVQGALLSELPHAQVLSNLGR